MGAAPLSWLAKIGGDTLKTKAKLLSSAINELYDDGFKKGNIVGLDYIKAATADNLKNKVPEANAVKELNSSLNNKLSINNSFSIPSMIEWQTSYTSAKFSVVSNRSRTQFLLMSGNNLAFIYINGGDNPIVNKLVGFTNLSITLESGSLSNHNTAIYKVTGLPAWASNCVILSNNMGYQGTDKFEVTPISS